GLYETPSSTLWMRRSSPTSRQSLSVASETWATPFTTSSGACSPHMASTAMVVTLLGLPRQAGAQRGRIDTYGERSPPVDREHRDLVPVRRRERGVRVDVDQREGERDVARHPLDHGSHLAAERALRPRVEGELDHPRRLTLRRPSSTDHGFARQERVPIRSWPTPSFVPEESSTAWPRATCCASSVWRARWA